MPKAQISTLSGSYLFPFVKSSGAIKLGVSQCKSPIFDEVAKPKSTTLTSISSCLSYPINTLSGLISLWAIW